MQVRLVGQLKDTDTECQISCDGVQWWIHHDGLKVANGQIANAGTMSFPVTTLDVSTGSVVTFSFGQGKTDL